MRYIFWGTPRFAEIVLKKLLDAGMAPVAVVCNPDKPVGRKKIITAPEVKVLISRHNETAKEKIAILQPAKLTPEAIEEIKTLNAEFFVVAAYGKILKETVLNLAPKGVLGVHPSLLPKLRGASPIQNTILQGEQIGTSIFLIDPGVDHGPVLAQTSLSEKADDFTYESLEEKLALMSGDLLIATLPKFLAGEIAPQAQNHEAATFTTFFKTEDGYIPFEDLQKAMQGDKALATRINRVIRALSQEPGAYTLKDGVRFKLLESKMVDSFLKIITIQKEGKKPSPFVSF